MQVLWRRQQATVAEVHAELLAERGLAPTTIATMLTKMERKGVVAHSRDGRRYVYRPTVSESEVRRSMISEMTERLFDGNATALVSHLISEHEINAQELDALRAQIERAEPDRTQEEAGANQRTQED